MKIVEPKVVDKPPVIATGREAKGRWHWLVSLPRYLAYAASAFCAILLVATPFMHAYTARIPMCCDGFVYAQAGKEMLQGKLLYSGVFLDKGPLSAVCFAIPQAMFPRSWTAVMFFTGIWLSVEGSLFWWVFRSRPVVALACILFLTLLPYTNIDFIWPSTGRIADLFVAGDILIAYTIYRDQRFSPAQAIAVGVLTCLAFNARQTGLLGGAMPACSPSYEWGLATQGGQRHDHGRFLPRDFRSAPARVVQCE